jgi:hypothetical protein
VYLPVCTFPFCLSVGETLVPRATPLFSLSTEGKFYILALRLVLHLICLHSFLYHDSCAQCVCVSVFMKSDPRSRFLTPQFYIFHSKGKES